MSFNLNPRFVKECFLGYHTRDMVYKMAFMPDGINLSNYIDVFHSGEELTSETLPSGGIIIDHSWLFYYEETTRYKNLIVPSFRYTIIYNATQANRIIGVFDLKGTANTDISNHLPAIVGKGIVAFEDTQNYSPQLFSFISGQYSTDLYENNELIGTSTVYSFLPVSILGGYHKSTNQYKIAFFTDIDNSDLLDEILNSPEFPSEVLGLAYKISDISGSYLDETDTKIGISADTCVTILNVKCPFILIYDATSLKTINLITLEDSYDNSVNNYPQGFPIYLGNMFISANKV